MISILFIFPSFACKTFGKAFEVQPGVFVSQRSVSCQADQTWTSIAESCQCKPQVSSNNFYKDSLSVSAGEKCVAPPPSPPTSSKLLLVNYNPASPPSHGEAVLYQCNAGPDHNRFSHDYNLWQLTVLCLPGNKFDNVTWPVCLNGEQN